MRGMNIDPVDMGAIHQRPPKIERAVLVMIIAQGRDNWVYFHAPSYVSLRTAEVLEPAESMRQGLGSMLGSDPKAWSVHNSGRR
jgi:hypothetical protein